MVRRFAHTFVALSSLAGCIDNTPSVAPLDASGSDGGASPDAATRADAGPSLGQPPRPDGDAGTTGCPVDPPRPTARCAGSNRACSYGSDPLAVCRPRFDCREGRWRSMTPTPCDVIALCPDGLDASVCPASRYPCFTTDARVCRCYSDVDGGVHWQCIGAGEGCPALAPNMGTPCAPPDGGGRFECGYGPGERCGPDFFVTCVDGTWQAAINCTE